MEVENKKSVSESMAELKKSLPTKPVGVFTPSPVKLVRFVDKNGVVVKEVFMNRADRRRNKIGRKR